MNRRELLVGAGASALLASTIGSRRANATSIPVGIYTFPNAGEASYCGAYGSPCGTATQRLNDYESACGVTASYCDVFTSSASISAWNTSGTGPWGWTNEGGPFANAANGGRLTPIIGMPLATSDGAMTFATVAAGTNDSMFTGWIQAWIDQGFHNLIVRPQWEFNLQTLPGSQQYGSTYSNWSVPFVAALKHLSVLLKDYCATRGTTIKMAWNPNLSNGLRYTGAITNSYPYGLDSSGRPYNDYIGFDIYDNCYPPGLITWAGYYNTAPAFTNGGTSSGAAPDIQHWLAGVAGSYSQQDNVYHYLDWGGDRSTSYVANLKGNENTFGMMDAIYFAHQTGRPLLICESGLFVNCTGTGTVAAYYDLPSGGAPWRAGVGDTWFPQYMKSRLTFAQAQGVTVQCMMMFVADPNDFLGPFPQVAAAYKTQAF